MGVARRVWEVVVPQRYQQMIHPLAHLGDSRAGLPPGLDGGILERACRRAYGRAPVSTRYAPMRGYKDSTHRLFIRLRGMRLRTMVFKDARISAEDYPAIAGFPGAAGMPEWDVLSSKASQMDECLPDVHWAGEVTPRAHYQFLTADLAWSHRHPSMGSDLTMVVERHRHLLDLLQAWSEDTDYEPRVHHGLSVAEDFLAYVWEALGKFDATFPSDLVAGVLDERTELGDLYLSVDSVGAVAPLLIHGDYSGQNMFVSATRPGELRLVDWEWMGLGLPHIDLASALKLSPEHVQREMVRRYFEDDETLVEREHWRVFLWAMLGRTLLDAALHAGQNAGGVGHTPGAVAYHIGRMRTVVRLMEAG